MKQGKRVRILLAEDNVSTGRMYAQFLESKGFEVDYVLDGEQALAAMQRGGYTLVLLDVRMPKIDGLKVLGELQKSPPQIKNGPIVMLTNLTDEALVKKAMALGALSYMDKSNLNPTKLVEKVAGVLGMPVEMGD